MSERKLIIDALKEAKKFDDGRFFVEFWEAILCKGLEGVILSAPISEV